MIEFLCDEHLLIFSIAQYSDSVKIRTFGECGYKSSLNYKRKSQIKTGQSGASCAFFRIFYTSVGKMQERHCQYGILLLNSDTNLKVAHSLNCGMAF